MTFSFKHFCFFILIAGLVSCKELENTQKVYFEPTEHTSRSWVYWYWMKSAYSKEGITADLEAMKQAGIAGAYLMTIKGPDDPPLIDPPVLQLSDPFWDMIHWALTEADRLDIKIAFHPADGFAVAGGPWITPEISMQKVVWADTVVIRNDVKGLKLPVPKHYENYYKDIATFAMPINERYASSAEIKPHITTSDATLDASFLSNLQKDGNLRFKEPGWIQYEFETPFTCKSIQIETKGNNYQAHRLLIEVSDDGKEFKSLGRLQTPRHGWQDTDVFYTHSIIPTTAKYFRFIYNPDGTEPGAEDLDSAKWNQGLKVAKILLSDEPLIDNYQGKSGAVWRISGKTTSDQISNEVCVEKSQLINISKFVDAEGVLNWEAPAGTWRIMRFGHTSTGHENATGGAGRGLEVDKFNADAVRFQLDHWFGEMLRKAGPELASRVVDILHMDSWECGSQNWSPVFQSEFKKRRGYDIIPYLPVMAGVPIESIEVSEGVLYDVRKTISELIVDNFFGTLAEEAKKTNVKFSSENVAPTMTSDGLLHFKHIDFPSGEFWLKSPTHDKPNDMLDAISGGHIYGKDIIQAEAFTELRMDWDEHPGNLKTLGDRFYALGINRFFYHVFVHNPWVDRKPGMTLDGIGTFFQRDQTWWEPGKAFFDYHQRTQFQLQKGHPVIDLAVFTGENIPSRSVLPDRLLPFIPNVFGENRIASEEKRLQNDKQPSAKMPKEVTYSKNSTDLMQWIDALNGYKYDSFNADVLINDAHVKNGQVIFRGGITYKALLFPGPGKMTPNNEMSLAVAERIVALVREGATVLIADKPTEMPGLVSNSDKEKWQKIVDELWTENTKSEWHLGKGRVVKLPYVEADFSSLGFSPDLITDAESGAIAWTHRETAESDIYFLSHQKDKRGTYNVSFRITGKVPYLYNPVTDKEVRLKEWRHENGRTIIPLQLDKNESGFVIFKENTKQDKNDAGKNWSNFKTLQTLNEDWTLQFNPEFHGPADPIKITTLFDWRTSHEEKIKHYSGTVAYTKTFHWESESKANLWLHFEEINNLAAIRLNGKDLGVIWTFPYRINISDALQKGENTLVVKVTNTWANRLIGDQKLPEEKRLTWTTAPYRLEGHALLKGGLLGAITVEEEND